MEDMEDIEDSFAPTPASSSKTSSSGSMNSGDDLHATPAKKTKKNPQTFLPKIILFSSRKIKFMHITNWTMLSRNSVFVVIWRMNFFFIKRARELVLKKKSVKMAKLLRSWRSYDPLSHCLLPNMFFFGGVGRLLFWRGISFRVRKFLLSWPMILCCSYMGFCFSLFFQAFNAIIKTIFQVIFHFFFVGFQLSVNKKISTIWQIWQFPILMKVSCIVR